MAVAISKAMLICIVAILVGLSASNALIVPTIPTNLTVSGQVFCSRNGASCFTCPPLVGARVDIRVSGTTVRSTTTGVDGRFTITAGNLNNIFSLLSVRVLVIPPQAGNCSALSNVALEGIPIPIRTRLVNGFIVIEAIVRIFLRVPLPVALPPAV